MVSIIFGVVVAGGSGAGLWYFMPRNGQVHPLAKRPLLDSLIPITIITSFAFGLAMIISGIGIQ